MLKKCLLLSCFLSCFILLADSPYVKIRHIKIPTITQHNTTSPSSKYNIIFVLPRVIVNQNLFFQQLRKIQNCNNFVYKSVTSESCKSIVAKSYKYDSGSKEYEILDLAGGDLRYSDEVIFKYLSGYCRCLSRSNRQIMFIYMFDEETLLSPELMRRYHEVVALYEKFADYYNINSINLGDYILDEIKQKHLTADKLFFKHSPTVVIQNTLVELLKAEPNVLQFVDSQFREESPIIASGTGQMIFVPYDGYCNMERDDGWLDWQLSPAPRIFPHVANCVNSGKELTFRFIGSAVGIAGIRTNESGDIKYKIDDGEWQQFKLFHKLPEEQAYEVYYEPLEINLPSQEHKLSLCVIESIPQGSSGHRFSFGGFILYGKGIPLEDMSKLSPIEKCDKIYAQIKPQPIWPKLPDDRFDMIQRTMEKLRNKQSMTVLMLGDSIINDINRSDWLYLLEQHYGAKITKKLSVLGSTGMDFYSKPENFGELKLSQFLQLYFKNHA